MVRAHLVLMFCVGVGLAAQPQASTADSTVEAARALFERGEKHFQAGRFLEAAADFEAAYKLTPRPDLLYDAAQAYERAGDPARAVEMYQAYLRSGESLPDEPRVRARLEELRPRVAFVLVRANRDGATVFIDGRERATTPMLTGVPVLGGTHLIEVRLGEMVWRVEQDFASGLDHTVVAELIPPPPPEKPERRMAVLLGLGGVIDVRSGNFPPSQAQLQAGFDYRVLHRPMVALDVSGRIPVELGQGWVHVAILPGVRLVLRLSRQYGLELVPSLDVGLSVLQLNKASAPPLSLARTSPCGVAIWCTLPALRLHPALYFVYRFLPHWELRGELFGLVADLTSPVPDPRVSFGLSAAWRFR
ncbi:MAG: tetratricopeptide repeat protein [Myxococcales bacterium]|nr:tetratricopeptide repeat protein [Myxococcota bacterium]MDW8281845.1 tetratricopeptide repeat protein [Myxococcales bacterium]